MDLCQSQGQTIDRMAETLQRSRDAIKIKLGRLSFKKIRICQDCGKKIFNAHFNRLRCVICSKIHTDKRKKYTSAIFHKNNRGKINGRRLLERWGKTREIVLKRDEEKCVECGLTREEHLKKYNKDIVTFNPNIKNRKDRKYFKDDPKELITVCLSCQGKLRVKHRSKDYSMCGGKPGMKPETKAQERDVRCYLCGKLFKIYYDPIKQKERWRLQKCPHCGGRPNYTSKEKPLF